MLRGNYSVLLKSPGRFLGGGTVAPERANWGQNGARRNFAYQSGASTAVKLFGVPDGARPPYSTLMPIEQGMMTAHYTARISVSGTASGLLGKPAEGSAAITVYTNTPAGELVVSGSGTAALSVYTNTPLMTASLSGSGTASFVVAGGSTTLTALGWGTGAAAFIVSGALVPFATGALAGLAKLAGDTAVVEVQYQGRVYVSDFGADGVEYPAGTATYPCRTLAGADYIANKYSLREYYLTGDFVLDKSYEHVEFNGWGPLQFCQIDLNNQLLDTVHFDNCVVTGQLNAVVVAGGGWQSTMAKVDFDKCYLFEVVDLEGIAKGCQIEGATQIKAGGWLSATETVIEGDFTVFDLRSTTGTTVSMDVVSGWSQFINAVTGCLIELNVKGGEVSLDASCTGGEFYLEGVGTLFNDSAMTQKENHFIWDDQMSYHLDVGSTGAKLNSAASAGDPWGTALPGTYPAGSAGNLLGNMTSNGGLTLSQFLALK